MFRLCARLQARHPGIASLASKQGGLMDSDFSRSRIGEEGAGLHRRWTGFFFLGAPWLAVLQSSSFDCLEWGKPPRNPSACRASTSQGWEHPVLGVKIPRIEGNPLDISQDEPAGRACFRKRGMSRSRLSGPAVIILAWESGSCNLLSFSLRSNH